MKPPWWALPSCDACSRPAPPGAPRSFWSAMPISWPRSKPAAACSSSSARTCRGRSVWVRCGGCATPPSAMRRWRCDLHAATGCAKRSAGIATTIACTPGTPSPWPPTPPPPTLPREGKDVAILCDTWEIADAINQRLHHHFTVAEAPIVPVARDQHVRAGDLILSRRNDASLTVEPRTQHHRGERIDQVRNGNRWRVLGVDDTGGRITAERLTDSARVVFEGDYLREHVTLGYAGTLHSAQGMTIGSANYYGICWSIISDRASRAMAYVGMTRGRDENHLAIYPAVTDEAHQHDTETGIHQMHRGTKHAAAHALRAILTVNDDRAATMHAVAARTDRQLLPTIVAALLDRNNQRCAERAQAWRRHTAQDRARDAAFERIAATTQQAAHRERSHIRGQGYGLEL